ncbi:hypothetical protein ACQ4PT_010807 [Festuca glaucescens]
MKEDAPTASATSRTPSSATSSPSSPPRKAPTHRSSRPGGATSGAPPLSTSTVVASSRMRVNSLVLYHVSFPPTKARAAASASPADASASERLPWTPGSSPPPSTTSTRFVYVVRVNPVSIRSIGVRAENYLIDELKFGELIIENAPCLEKLLHLDLRSVLHVSVIFAPKLETLRCHSDTSTKVSFGSTVIQGLHISIPTVVRSIKILSVDMDILSLDKIIDLMRCFPCLEKLYVQSYKSGPNNWWLIKHKNLIRYHDIRLKKIVFKTYCGIKSQVSFMTFFVLNARVLESMTLRIEAKNYNEEFLAKHRKKLQLENRASRGARVQFTTDICVRNVWDIKDVHDLDLADPFAC